MKKQIKTLTTLIIILCILVLGLGGYIIYDKVLSKEDSPVVDNDNKEENSKYKVEDFVVVIDKVETTELNGIKVNYNLKTFEFKNIDESVVKEFITRQNTLNDYIKTCGPLDKEGNKLYSYDISTQVNDNILTVYAMINNKCGIGQDELNVININLDTLKKVDNEEILKKGNSSYEKIANEYYEYYLNLCKTNKGEGRGCYFKKIDGTCNENEMIYRDDLIDNKDYYLKLIKDSLDENIIAYIEKDNNVLKIKYDYQPLIISTSFSTLCKGGPFPYETVELEA